MTLPVCCECCQEMFCACNEVLVHTHGVVRYGDRFECPSCHNSIVVNFAAGIMAPTKQNPDVDAFLESRSGYEEIYEINQEGSP